MINIKFLVEKDKRDDTIKKLFFGTKNYIKKIFSDTETTEDDYYMEIFTGNKVVDSDQMIIEISVKKKICINKKDLKQRSEIDRVIDEIKFFCSKSKEIENYRYRPINFRNRDANKWAIFTGTRIQ